MSMRRAGGFTLLELMVTLVIIGIILTFAVLSIGNKTAEQVETEARRLAALTDLASQEAVLQSREIGIRFERGGYRFLTLGLNGWQSLEGDAVLKPRALPGVVRMDLYLEGLPVEPAEDPAAPPQVMLFSSGERTPFEVIIRPATEPNPRFRFSGPLLGKFSFEGPLS